MSERLEKVSETLSVYQSEKVFPYGTDAVLLSKFANTFFQRSKSKKTICDLCSGTGIVSLMLADIIPTLCVSAIDINEDAVRLSNMSAEVSGLSERFTAYRADIKDAKNLLGPDHFDAVVCNPPYMTDDCGYMCENENINIARHAMSCDISDVFSASRSILKTKGDLFLVCRTERLGSVFCAAKESGFAVKDIVFLHTRPKKTSNVFLCRAKYGAGEGLFVHPPLYIYDDNGGISADMEYITKEGVFGYVK